MITYFNFSSNKNHVMLSPMKTLIKGMVQIGIATRVHYLINLLNHH